MPTESTREALRVYITRSPLPVAVLARDLGLPESTVAAIRRNKEA